VHLHLYLRPFFRKTVKNRRKTVAEMKISAIFYLGKVLINRISLKTISDVYPAVFPALSVEALRPVHHAWVATRLFDACMA
jgi:hypothetical protein